MSGPDNPTPPEPLTAPAIGGNAIGDFDIGFSPIGIVSFFDFWWTVISQYANSPIMTAIIQSFFAAADQTQNFENFYDDIWNVDTAQGYGLDVWGRIVGITRTIQIQGLPIFGFKESTTAVGFGQGMFFQGPASSQNYVLNDNSFRTLIFAKALANITTDSIPAINNILMTLFGASGDAWVSDGGAPTAYFGFKESTTAVGFGQGPFWTGRSATGMQMVYNFAFPLTPIDLGIINSGVLPKPAGVYATVKII